MAGWHLFNNYLPSFLSHYFERLVREILFVYLIITKKCSYSDYSGCVANTPTISPSGYLTPVRRLYVMFHLLVITEQPPHLMFHLLATSSQPPLSSTIQPYSTFSGVWIYFCLLTKISTDRLLDRLLFPTKVLKSFVSYCICYFWRVTRNSTYFLFRTFFGPTKKSPTYFTPNFLSLKAWGRASLCCYVARRSFIGT